jgi:hypothetical protein
MRWIVYQGEALVVLRALPSVSVALSPRRLSCL